MNPYLDDLDDIDQFGEGQNGNQEKSCGLRCRLCCGSFCHGLKKLLTFLVSHVGLVAVVVGYCLAGAFTFEKLERENEISVKNDIKNIRAKVSDDIWVLTNEAEVLKAEDWMKEVNKRMKKFELELIRAMRKDGWNGYESHDMIQWTFTGSLFYSIVCITTIGYGDQTPKTAPGKLVTILYAILGMPLMLFCLSKTGHAMASSFRFLYWRICCFLCITSRSAASSGAAKKRFLRERNARSITSRTFSVRSSGSRGSNRRMSQRRKTQAPNWALSDSISQINMTEESRSNQIPQIFATDDFDSQQADEDEECFPVVDTEPRSAARINKAKRQESEELVDQMTMKIDRGDELRDSKKSQKSVKSLSLTLPVHRGSTSESIASPGLTDPTRQSSIKRSSFRSKEDEGEFIVEYPVGIDFVEEQNDVRKKDIPLWICAVLVIGYIIGGAFLFANWEKWTFLDSAYFCFITLTTIGFGDFVPKAEEKENTELSIALCSVYLLFGMSLLVMTFSLVQQRVIDQVRRVAQRLGIIKEDEFEFE